MQTLWSTSPVGLTGRTVVLFAEGTEEAGARGITAAIGAEVADTRSAPDGMLSGKAIERGRALLFSELGVAVIDARPEQLEALSAAEHDAVLAIEPERTVYAQVDPGPPRLPSPAAGSLSPDYLRGFRDAADAVLRAGAPARGPGLDSPPEAGPARPVDESQATWGLQAVGATTSAHTGSGVAVAVLDTGVDLEHPDLDTRRIVSQSFVLDEEVQDGNGHGTHCIGTACGPRRPDLLPHYGVAPDAQIFAGKVLSNRGTGTDASILGGIEWAVRSGCQIISMSLGARATVGQEYSRIFETVARRALRRGTLVVAAAGNDSARSSGFVAPVSHPANCPSILAVGALDAQGGIADFSNRGIDQAGGQLDFAAPGVDVLSTWPMPRRYRRISGTSMATPHVSGVLALIAEANPGARADELVALAFKGATRLGHPSHDVGAGLIQAP